MLKPTFQLPGVVSCLLPPYFPALQKPHHLIIINDKTPWLDNSTILSTGAYYRRIAARDRHAALQARSNEKHKLYDSPDAAQNACFFALILDSGGAVKNE
jgi:hypothetical protein